MNFPNTNKIRKAEELTGDNMKLLEEHLAKINWNVFVKCWCYFASILLVTIFSFIVVIRFAYIIF